MFRRSEVISEVEEINRKTGKELGDSKCSGGFKEGERTRY